MTYVAKALLLTLFIMTSSTPPSQTLTEQGPECSEERVGKVQLTKEDITILGLTIGSASLKDVEARFGTTASLPTHGSVSASNTICFVSPTDGTVLTFGASGLGGFVDVTEFAIWSREAHFPNVSKCRPSKLISRSVSTLSGIRLGLSVNQLTSIVGTQPTTNHAVTSYDMACRQKMTADQIKGFKTANNWDVTKSPYFDVSSSVDARFSGSGAFRIHIAKTESY